MNEGTETSGAGAAGSGPHGGSAPQGGLAPQGASGTGGPSGISGGTASPAAKDRTWLAVLVAILGVVPGMLLAAVLVIVYRFFLAGIVGGHWIPYLEEVALLWFPELLRGLITSFVALGLAGLVRQQVNMTAVGYALAGFWGGIYLLLVVIGVNITGITMDLIGVIAYALGFGLGVYFYLQDR